MGIHPNAQAINGEALRNALAFDGVDDALLVGTGSNTNCGVTGQDSIAIELYMFWSAAPSGPEVLAKVGNAGTGWGVGWSDASGSGRLYFVARNGATSGPVAFSCAFSPTPGQEYHVRIENVSNTTKAISIDDVAQSVSTTDNNLWSFTANLSSTFRIGSDTGGDVMHRSTGNPGGFTTGTGTNDLATFTLRWAAFETYNGTAWTRQLEYHIDEGAGDPVDEIISRTATREGAVTWLDDFGAPIGVAVTARAMDNRVTCSRIQDWREGFKGSTSQMAAPVRLQVQRSTTGAFAGEETTLVDDLPSVSEISLYKHTADGGSSDWTTPLDADEQFIDDQVSNATTYHYRLRYVEWSGGSIIKSGRWSQVVNATWSNADYPTAAPDPSGYTSSSVPQLNRANRAGVMISIGQTLGNDPDAVKFIGMSNTARNGPVGWAGRMELFRNRAGNTAGFFVVVKPGGNTLSFTGGTGDDTDTVPTTHVRYGTVDVPGSIATQGNSVDTSVQQIEHAYQNGIDLIAAGDAVEGAKFIEMIDQWTAALRVFTVTHRIPCIAYTGLVRDNSRTHDAAAWSLDDSYHLNLVREARWLIGMDSAAACPLTDPDTGKDSAIKVFADKMAADHPGVFWGGETGLRRQRTRATLENITNYFTINEKDLVFQATASGDGVALTLETNNLGTDDDALDPAAYPDVDHVFFVSSSTSNHVASQPDNASKMEAIIDVAVAILAYAPNCFVCIGSDTFVNNNITNEQWARYTAAGQAGGPAAPTETPPPPSRRVPRRLASQRPPAIYGSFEK